MSEILFTNCRILDAGLGYTENFCVGVSGSVIDYVGEYKKGALREYDCNGGIIMPALCNAHAHSAMTLLRGIGEDVKLQDWLETIIFPAEAKLSANDCYIGTTLAVAEMLKYGTASCNDMYFFGPSAMQAYIDAGFKANFAPSYVCFDNSKFEQLAVYDDYIACLDISKKSELVKLDVAIHAVYTVAQNAIEGAVRFASDNRLGIHTHVSETVKENTDCKNAHGTTPTERLEKLGVFGVRTVAAHCVHLTDNDRKILKKHNVTVASCPQSNLKLGSGICDYNALRAEGVNIAVATDSVASNNSLNMVKEARLAALLSKGVLRDAAVFGASDAISCANANGYISQGRNNSGVIKCGMDADLALFPANDVNMIPNGDLATAMLYSSDGISEMTMVNGKILYEKGIYHTLDIEKTLADSKQIRGRINGK